MHWLARVVTVREFQTQGFLTKQSAWASSPVSTHAVILWVLFQRLLFTLHPQNLYLLLANPIHSSIRSFLFVLGLHWCTGSLHLGRVVSVCRLLTAVAVLIAEQRLRGTWVSVAVALGPHVLGLSGCGTRSSLTLGLWHPSSWSKESACVPCVGRWILNH